MLSQPSDLQSFSSRDRLLQAAKRLFARHGYEQTPTSAIAREAGTSESQLMRYFGGKVGLLEALFNDAWDQLHERIRKAAAESASSRDTILAVLQVLVSAFARDPDLATLFLFEGRRLRSESPKVRLSRGLVTFAELARTLVRRGQAAREFDRSLDAGAMTSALLGACEAMIRDRILARVSGSRAFAEREIRRTLEAMLNGFTGAAGGTAKARVSRSRSAR